MGVNVVIKMRIKSKFYPIIWAHPKLYTGTLDMSPSFELNFVSSVFTIYLFSPIVQTVCCVMEVLFYANPFSPKVH